MVFRGLFGWIFGRRKDEEEEVPLAWRIMELDMMKQIEKDMDSLPVKRIRRKIFAPYIPPTEYGLTIIKEKRIFFKVLGGIKVGFTALLLGRFDSKHYFCAKCKRPYKGILYATKYEKWIYFCPRCFKTIPNWDKDLETIKRKRLNNWR